MVEAIASHTAHLVQAFAQDGYTVDPHAVFRVQDKVGMRAEHRTATNYDTGQKKCVYYIEGAPWQMGYLLGRMAEPEIDRMTTKFTDKALWEFTVGGITARDMATGARDMPTGPGQARALRIHSLHDLLIELIYDISQKGQVSEDIPLEYQEEMKGIIAGCQEANPDTKVRWEDLWVLNVGFDCLLSLAYTGRVLREQKIAPSRLRVPLMCNAFAIFGDAAGGGHYLGRDFMFPTGGVFQDVACLVIYNPSASAAGPSLPFVSMTAPGIVGSIAAMNTRGVGAGVDVIPAANCNPDRPGLNSLLLVRHSIQQGDSAQSAVDVMVRAQCGVSWDYIIADGTEDVACIVEAGYSTDRVPFLDYVDDPSWKALLPDAHFLAAHPSGEVRNGLMVRWNDFRYPEIYAETFNPKLWARLGKTLYPDALAPLGYINRIPSERNCPESYYFAPQRKTRDDIVLASNHFLLPEMRLCAMHRWTNSMAKGSLNDIQWRYDELNHRIMAALWEKERRKDKQGIRYDEARELIDFLARFPHYYDHNPRSRDGEQIAIGGSVSLCDVKHKTIECHFGYYVDAWIKISLGRYTTPA